MSDYKIYPINKGFHLGIHLGIQEELGFLTILVDIIWEVSTI